ncbi:MAG: VOC family protein [Myxococcales bacterium]|nr:VOC family protein [Myxococcales bacterium]
MQEVSVKKGAVELDHISVPVRRFREARRFYEAALGAIGMTVNMEFDDACGLGANGEKIFWLVRDRKASGGGHYALRVARREQVQAFYDAAIDAGGTDNGPPGLRPSYGPSYFAAFVKDGERNNIEIVCYTKPRRGAPVKRPVVTRPRTRRRPS